MSINQQNHNEQPAALFAPAVEAEDTPAAFTEAVGELIFKSALMQQIQLLSEAEAVALHTFIETHAEEESFMEQLTTAYPDFEKILAGEMEAFQSEMRGN